MVSGVCSFGYDLCYQSLAELCLSLCSNGFIGLLTTGPVARQTWFNSPGVYVLIFSA